MKKVMISLFICMFLIGLVSAAQNESKNTVQNRENFKNCGDGICQNAVCAAEGCPIAENFKNCPEDCSEDNNNKNENKSDQGLGKTIRNRVKAGVYTSPEGKQIRVSEMAQNRTKLRVGNVEADCDCELTEEKIQNRTRLKTKLSNGRNAEIKIMPDTASETALNKLRLKVCSEKNNCSIELKEVGQGEKTQLAYELQTQRHFRLLGMFKIKAQTKAQINAETGDLIRIKKPWWAFLASEPEE